MSCMPHTMHLLSFLFLGLLGFLQLVPTATFELAVGPNWQPDSSGGQRTLHFPFHRVTKLVGLSRRLRRRLGRTSRRPTQGDSASRSPALPFPLSLLRGRRAWPLSRLWAVKWPAKRMGLLSLPFSSGLTRRGRRTSADAIISRGHLAAPPAGALAKQQTPLFAWPSAILLHAVSRSRPAMHSTY